MTPPAGSFRAARSRGPQNTSAATSRRYPGRGAPGELGGVSAGMGRRGAGAAGSCGRRMMGLCRSGWRGPRERGGGGAGQGGSAGAERRGAGAVGRVPREPGDGSLREWGSGVAPPVGPGAGKALTQGAPYGADTGATAP